MANLRIKGEMRAQVYDEKCIGCQSTDSETMLSLFAPGSNHIDILDGNNKSIGTVSFVDIFMSKQELLRLKNTIEEFLKNNEDPSDVKNV